VNAKFTSPLTLNVGEGEFPAWNAMEKIKMAKT